MNLSIKQLITFCEVMRSGSISQAARTLNRTQPAISTLINTLESDVGFNLFLREHGKLIPTPEAQYFLEEAEAVLQRLDRTKQTLNRVRSLESGKLRVACYPAASTVFVPRFLTNFLTAKPDIELTLVMRDSTTIADLIASQQFDVGLAETPPLPRASVQQQAFDLACVCVMAKDHPLANNDLITPAVLDNCPMATLFPEHHTANALETAFLQSGHRLNKRIELRTFLPGLPLVEAGFCVMVCDMVTAYSHVLLGPHAEKIIIKRFVPSIRSSISLLLPAYMPQALLTQSFSKGLLGAIERMQGEMSSFVETSTVQPVLGSKIQQFETTLGAK